MKENILDTLCLSCMKDVGEEFEYCLFCGAPKNIENQFHQLAPKSVLNGRFVVGKTLGQGGFGITYAGYDVTTDEKVAIKEFYPDGGVSRQKDSYTILPYSEKKTEELFADGKAKFLKEAQKLVKFTDVEGIVKVKDYFEENGTAYIVMEYVEGPTLIQYLNKLGQPILPSDLYVLLTPIFSALEQVHAQGILHRDISPDNIIVSPSVAKLLDFGAARDFSLLGEKSNTINIKAGYAPEEQYLTHGKQGPWTDVYALAATCYRAVTGKTPASSIERLSGDILIAPSTLSPNVTPAIEQVLLKGMAVRKENRYQSVNEFHNAFSQAINGASAVSTVHTANQPVYTASGHGYTSQPQYNTSRQGYAPQPQPQPNSAQYSQQPNPAQYSQQQPNPGQYQQQANHGQYPQQRNNSGQIPPNQYNNGQNPGASQPYQNRQLNYSSSWNIGASPNMPQQGGMGAPPVYNSSPYSRVKNKPVISMISGIVSLVDTIISGVLASGIGSASSIILLCGIALSIYAICMGKSAKREGVGKGMATAGIVTGIVNLSFIAFCVLVVLIANS